MEQKETILVVNKSKIWGLEKMEMKMSKNLCAHHALKFISFNAI